jgi:hypothetical protein
VEGEEGEMVKTFELLGRSSLLGGSSSQLLVVVMVVFEGKLW